MESYKTTPSLGFAEGVKLAAGRMVQFNGRSRRSEFWWFMLAYIIVTQIISWIATYAADDYVATIVGLLTPLLALAVTVRRLQDGGHSKWWVISSYLFNIIYTIGLTRNGMMEIMESVNPDMEELIACFSSPEVIIGSLGSLVTALPTIVFCFMDGTPADNPYGPSPKYTAIEEETVTGCGKGNDMDTENK